MRTCMHALDDYLYIQGMSLYACLDAKAGICVCMFKEASYVSLSDVCMHLCMYVGRYACMHAVT